jgi:hypothetical protein
MGETTGNILLDYVSMFFVGTHVFFYQHWHCPFPHVTQMQLIMIIHICTRGDQSSSTILKEAVGKTTYNWKY